MREILTEKLPSNGRAYNAYAFLVECIGLTMKTRPDVQLDVVRCVSERSRIKGKQGKYVVFNPVI